MSDLVGIVIPLDLCLENDQWTLRWVWEGHPYQVVIDARSEDRMRAHILARATAMNWLSAGVTLSARSNIPLDVLADQNLLTQYLGQIMQQQADSIAAPQVEAKQADAVPVTEQTWAPFADDDGSVHTLAQRADGTVEIDPETIHDHVEEERFE